MAMEEAQQYIIKLQSRVAKLENLVMELVAAHNGHRHFNDGSGHDWIITLPAKSVVDETATENKKP